MTLCLNCCLLLLILKSVPSSAFLLVVPEDVSTGFATIYGFTPKFIRGEDHRLGFGFRFGNHADLQLMYEFGPQTHTRPLQPIRVRSAAYRQRVVRRRPLLKLLVKTGLLDLKNEQFEFEVTNGIDEPR